MIVTPRLRDSPYRVLRDGLPWTVLVMQQGIPAGHVGGLFGELNDNELDSWFRPWGIPRDANAWDYYDPELILHPDQVHPEQRLDTDTEAKVLDLLDEPGTP